MLKEKDRLGRIKLLALDFDGVMTDGFVYTDQEGRESVRCSRKDGLGIEMLKQAGVHVTVISKESNAVVKMRCKKLHIPCEQNVFDGEGKASILKRIVEEKSLSMEEVAYMGDDLNDEAVLQCVGIGVIPSDGHKKLKEIADVITAAKGGDHAVREVSEMILLAKDIEIKW